MSSNADRPPLRIGVLLDHQDVYRHELETLRHLRQSNFARVGLVIRDTPDDRSPSWLFRRYDAWDRRHVRPADDPIDRVSVAEEVAGVLAVPIARFDGAHVDVVLDFRSGPRATPAAPPAYGVWSLNASGNTPAAFWEIVESRPLTTMTLDAAEGDGSRVTLSRATVSTALGISWARNRLGAYWSANAFVIQKLKEVHERGWQSVRAAAEPAAPAQDHRRPTTWDVARWLTPAIVGKAAKRLRRRNERPLWRMGTRVSDRDLLVRGSGEGSEGFRWIDAPAGRSYADPFLHVQDGQVWVFFEDIDLATDRGRLSAARVAEDGTLGDAIPILTRPYHLSYPCVFGDAGELFMIPESSENRTVELYRCRRFPDDWVLERVLLRESLVDSTIWIEDGRYWLFTTYVEPRSWAPQLWLFTADSLTGAWTPHPASPISADARTARGAGAVFRQGGAIYRPSQDGSVRYGGTFSLNRIDVLTSDRYLERPVVTVEPPPGFVGTHSYARFGRLEMIDVCATVPVSTSPPHV